MAKKNLLTAKNKRFLGKVLFAVAGVLLLSVLIPALLPNATGNVKVVVDFFQDIQNHFKSLWMIYTFIGLVLLASIK